MSRIPVRMDHVGEEDVNIMLLYVVTTTILTKKGTSISAKAWTGQIKSIHNLPGSTCLLSCRLEKIQNPPVKKYLKD